LEIGGNEKMYLSAQETFISDEENMLPHTRLAAELFDMEILVSKISKLLKQLYPVIVSEEDKALGKKPDKASLTFHTDQFQSAASGKGADYQ